VFKPLAARLVTCAQWRPWRFKKQSEELGSLKSSKRNSLFIALTLVAIVLRALGRRTAELQPQQVISLLGLGGPSFPLADHDDHLHVGY
jgi:hypothetical protein